MIRINKDQRDQLLRMGFRIGHDEIHSIGKKNHSYYVTERKDILEALHKEKESYR